ncbi:MAG: 1-deoxy-D-xylulose-5-phosphate reductoisomerase [Lachnospiraceae bacterium]|nr:1-deoxy-D-xylulose-5-phosphate reductoisomerase [Lachnospiraceae bacterium]
MKKIAILGSTGSIGTQTLDIVRAYAQDLQVTALCAGKNTDLMERQIREFRPALAVMGDETAAADLRSRVADLPVRVLSGMEGMLEMAADPGSECLVTAIVGMIGIRPTIAAIEAGKDIALANKETLVCAGHIIMPLAARRGVRILPVDSEHSAIFQSLQGGRLPLQGQRSFAHSDVAAADAKEALQTVKQATACIHAQGVKRILLTASGGPFRGMTREQLAGKTSADALKHPNWNMGNKVTIDSASLVNKGLEVMEASWLFGMEPEDITVVVHPQSILHSAVEVVDGAVIGQMGVPDMKLPIQYALFYPDRRPMSGNTLDLFAVSALTFERPDTEVFRGLALALRAARTGGTMPTVFNAANEVAVARFLQGQIGFLEIYEEIERAMDAHRVKESPSVEEILEAQREVGALLGETKK